MAVDGRINVRHEDVFPVPVLVLGVEPINDFEKPLPPNGLMGPAEFDGLQVIPYVDTNRARPEPPSTGVPQRRLGYGPAAPAGRRPCPVGSSAGTAPTAPA